MVEQAEICNKLKEFIIDNFLIGSDFETIENSDSFMEKEIIDSTGILELTSFVEAEFEITVEDDEMIPENLDSIDNLAGFIMKKVS